MEIRIDRAWCKKGYTISRVFVNGKRYGDGQKWCSALEDEDRGLNQSMPEAEIIRKKIYGRTAIPRGAYNVRVTYSPRFRKLMPLVDGVKGFSGIRLHSGNTAANTEGCILFGVNDRVGRVSNSRYWTNKITALIEEATKKGEKIKLIIG